MLCSWYQISMGSVQWPIRCSQWDVAVASQMYCTHGQSNVVLRIIFCTLPEPYTTKNHFAS